MSNRQQRRLGSGHLLRSGLGALFLLGACGGLPVGPVAAVVDGSNPGEPTDMDQAAVAEAFRALEEPLTALAVVQLHDRGIVHLHESLAVYLPGSVDNSFPVAVTVDHLLTHTAGLAARGETRIWRTPGAWQVPSEPGRDLLHELILAVSGRSRDEFVQENILRPLGIDPGAPTGRDLVTLATMLVQGGTVDGVEVLSPEGARLFLAVSRDRRGLARPLGRGVRHRGPGRTRASLGGIIELDADRRRARIRVPTRAP